MFFSLILIDIWHYLFFQGQQLSSNVSIDLNGDVTVAKCDHLGAEVMEASKVVEFAEFFKHYRIFAKSVQSVSYTHLTLPTICSV